MTESQKKAIEGIKKGLLRLADSEGVEVVRFDIEVITKGILSILAIAENKKWSTDQKFYGTAMGIYFVGTRGGVDVKCLQVGRHEVAKKSFRLYK